MCEIFFVTELVLPRIVQSVLNLKTALSLMRVAYTSCASNFKIRLPAHILNESVVLVTLQLGQRLRAALGPCCNPQASSVS